MYLARKFLRGKLHCLLRESYRENGLHRYRDLYDLGEDPRKFIVLPGGNSFYFDGKMMQALAEQGVANADAELERLLLPYLPAEIRRIVVEMTRPARPPRKRLSKEAMAEEQARLHPFDRRRFFFHRYGRMDSMDVVMRPHRFLDVLANMSRDEMEYYFRDLEAKLQVRELKQYVYLALGLDRYFPGEIARLFPQGFDPESLDDAFMTDLCNLNRDPSYLNSSADKASDPDRLSEYLVWYAVMWFDYEFEQRPPQADFFEEFVRSRRFSHPPAPQPDMDLVTARGIFDLTEIQWRTMSRDEVSRAYRRLAMRRHPDQGGDAKEFIELSEAYERLMRDK